MERVKEFLTRYQEMNTNLDLFINEPDSFALKHQKVLPTSTKTMAILRSLARSCLILCLASQMRTGLCCC